MTYIIYNLINHIIYEYSMLCYVIISHFRYTQYGGKGENVLKF